MAEPQPMSVAAYCSINPKPAAALSGGDRNHNAQQRTPITLIASSPPRVARTDINLNRLTGSDKVNSVEPWIPLVVTNEGCVATPAPASNVQIIATSRGLVF